MSLWGKRGYGALHRMYRYNGRNLFFRHLFFDQPTPGWSLVGRCTFLSPNGDEEFNIRRRAWEALKGGVSTVLVYNTTVQFRR